MPVNGFSRNVYHCLFELIVTLWVEYCWVSTGQHVSLASTQKGLYRVFCIETTESQITKLEKETSSNQFNQYHVFPEYPCSTCVGFLYVRLLDFPHLFWPKKKT